METLTEKKAEAAAEGHHASLPRTLGVVSAIAVLVGSTIGTGIFRSPAGIATKVPFEELYLLLWVMGGFFSLCGALTLAELAGALPQTGGVFVYVREGWGPLAAFLFSSGTVCITRSSAPGAISTGFTDFPWRLLPKEAPQMVPYAAAGAI